VSVAFRGGRTCTCVATSLPVVEEHMLLLGLISNSLDIYQLGYRNDVGASAGTHAGGGNTDVGQFSAAHIKVWREAGWTIQHRTRSQGFDMDHGHGWPFGCPHLSAGGRSQAAQWKNRQNGLISRGRVQGPWPVVGWETGMKRLEEKNVALKDDIVGEIIARIRKEYDAIADAVLTRDGKIANTMTGNKDNKTLTLAGALSELGKNTEGIGHQALSAVEISDEYTPAPDKHLSPRASFALLMRRQRELNAKLDAIRPN
jgi:hypothetical protein